MAAGAALIDVRRQGAHTGDTPVDLDAEQHAAATRFRALPDDHLDRVGAPQIVGIQSIAGWQHLVDQ